MVIGSTLASDNPLRFRKNLLERYNTIKDGKIQDNINREAAKISALSLSKIDKYEYLTSQDILLSDQSRIKEQEKSKYSLLGKAFEKQINAIEDQGEKQMRNGSMKNN